MKKQDFYKILIQIHYIGNDTALCPLLNPSKFGFCTSVQQAILYTKCQLQSPQIPKSPPLYRISMRFNEKSGPTFSRKVFGASGGPDPLSGQCVGGAVCQDPILRIDLLKCFQFADSVIEVSEFLFVILF